MNKTIQSCSQVCNRSCCNITRCLPRSCASLNLVRTLRTGGVYFFVAGGDGGFALSFGLLFQFVRFMVHGSSTHSAVQYFGLNRLQQLVTSFCSKTSNTSLRASAYSYPVLFTLNHKTSCSLFLLSWIP